MPYVISPLCWSILWYAPRVSTVRVSYATYVASSSYECMLLCLSQNTGRILRGLFEIFLKRGVPALASLLLMLCKCVDHRQWMFEHPLKQFAGDKLTPDILNKLEQKNATIERLKDLDKDEIGELYVSLHNPMIYFKGPSALHKILLPNLVILTRKFLNNKKNCIPTSHTLCGYLGDIPNLTFPINMLPPPPPLL